jgi:hypothetical protein
MKSQPSLTDSEEEEIIEEEVINDTLQSSQVLSYTEYEERDYEEELIEDGDIGAEENSAPLPVRKSEYITVEEIIDEGQEEEVGGKSDDVEEFLSDIRSSLFAYRAALTRPEHATRQSNLSFESASTVESEYEEQVIEKWFRKDEEPEDLHAACKALIGVVYKGEDVDVEGMMRRSPLPELYKYLKQHYDYKVITNQVEEEPEKPETKKASVQDIFKKHVNLASPITTESAYSFREELVEEGEGEDETTPGKSFDDGADIIIRVDTESEEWRDDPSTITHSFSRSLYTEEVVEDSVIDSVIRDSTVFESIAEGESVKRSKSVVFLEELRTSVVPFVVSIGDADSIGSEEWEFEAGIVDKWLDRDDEPDDYETACRALIQVVFKGLPFENADIETMLRRSPLPELYKYLKQHYWYKVHKKGAGEKSDLGAKGTRAERVSSSPEEIVVDMSEDEEAPFENNAKDAVDVPKTMKEVVVGAAEHGIKLLVGAGAKGQDGNTDPGLSQSSFDGSVEEEIVEIIIEDEEEIIEEEYEEEEIEQYEEEVIETTRRQSF